MECQTTKHTQHRLGKDNQGKIVVGIMDQIRHFAQPKKKKKNHKKKRIKTLAMTDDLICASIATPHSPLTTERKSLSPRDHHGFYKDGCRILAMREYPWRKLRVFRSR
jgi:hypothetical protein